MIKWGSLAALVVQNSSLFVLTRSTRLQHSEGDLMYLASVVVLVVEVSKLTICLVVLWLQGSLFVSLRQHIWDERRETCKLAVPASCYALQNNLVFLAISNLSATAAQVLYQKLCECRSQLHMAIKGGRLPELEDALRYATTLRFREDPQQRAQLLAADALALEAEAGLALERLDLQRLREVRDDAHRLGVSLASRAAIARLLQLQGWV